MNEDSKRPVTSRVHEHNAGGGTKNRDWWPNQLKLDNKVMNLDRFDLA